MKKVKFGKPVRGYGWWTKAPDEDNLNKEYHTPPVHIKEVLKVDKSSKKVCTVKGW